MKNLFFRYLVHQLLGTIGFVEETAVDRRLGQMSHLQRVPTQTPSLIKSSLLSANREGLGVQQNPQPVQLNKTLAFPYADLIFRM
ncbi:MAG: hypothetical protein K2M42_10820 [Oscillospiraceae bacterium]|nr:hypothetical protein [Oscillospiraceae bacterium]